MEMSRRKSPGWADALWFAVAFGLCAAAFNWASVVMFDWWDPVIGDPAANARLGYVIVGLVLVPVGTGSYLLGLWFLRSRLREGRAIRAIVSAVLSCGLFSWLMVTSREAEWLALVGLIWFALGPGLLGAMLCARRSIADAG